LTPLGNPRAHLYKLVVVHVPAQIVAPFASEDQIEQGVHTTSRARNDVIQTPAIVVKFPFAVVTEVSITHDEGSELLSPVWSAEFGCSSTLFLFHIPISWGGV